MFVSFDGRICTFVVPFAADESSISRSFTQQLLAIEVCAIEQVQVHSENRVG